ncbi:PTS lactose/cellobiose transporter subunit IIA [Streptococcus halichoeri]|uniref:PTS lactose/cellobiose transporter subunit IIA n=1 Tax=Streptococcus halichoeri TaxID=254785 RepID=UPI001356A6D3|nr:PTS lactose/cellobiose transporter subunit IIA [Streptococcus halichoeri]
MKEQDLETVMGLIMFGGDAKGKAAQAITAAKQFDFEQAEQKIQEATQALNQAHKAQTKLLTQEASGDTIRVSLLMVHGQDHLMNAITFIDMAKEMVDVYRQLARVR